MLLHDPDDPSVEVKSEFDTKWEDTDNWAPLCRLYLDRVGTMNRFLRQTGLGMKMLYVRTDQRKPFSEQDYLCDEKVELRSFRKESKSGEKSSSSHSQPLRRGSFRLPSRASKHGEVEA